MSDDTPAPASTAATADLKREIASIDRSITDVLLYGGGSKILLNGDEVLRARGRSKGLALYSELERDAHAGSLLAKRKRAVTSREWGVTPASEDAADVEVAEFVKATVAGLKFDKLTRALLDATLKGFSVAELIWDVRDGRLVPVRFKKRNQVRFVFDIDWNLRLLTRENGLDGEALPDRKFITHRVGESDDSPYGTGVGRQLFWPVYFKRQNISFWLIFNDKFGSPTTVGKYPRGTSESEQASLLSAIRRISQEAGLIVPEGMEVELMEAARTGGDCYERLCQYMDAEISKAVLGETLTTQVGKDGGSYALGDVHNEVRLETAKDDADDLSDTLNATLVKWIVDLNFPGRVPPTLWRNFEEEADLSQQAETDAKIKDLGWQRTEESFIEIYGPGFERSAAPPSESALPIGPTFSEEKSGWITSIARRVAGILNFSAPSRLDAERARRREDQQTMADTAGAIGERWEGLLGGRVQELQTLLDETGDLALFSERLKEIVDQEPNAQVVEALARASFGARLAGRMPRSK